MSAPRIALVICALVAPLSSLSLGGTVAYWRFENGVPNTPVPHSTPGGVFDGTTPDVSGNGNHLSAWAQGGGSGFNYRSDVPFSAVPQSGATNFVSIKNSGGSPACFTDAAVSLPTGVNIDTFTPLQWTVEVAYKPEINGGYRTVLCRDARNISNSDGNLAALYLQIRPDDSVGVAFTDVSGFTHYAYSAPGWMYGFVFGSNPEGVGAPWYRLAASCDGATLKMYVDNVLVASTNLSASGTPNPALAKGSVNGGDWKAGAWAVGRGLYGGGHTDRAYGLIDEVRISDTALPLDQLLGAAQPGLTEITMGSNSVTLKASGGAANSAIRLYQSNDPARPFSQWPNSAVGTTDANGNHTFVRSVNTAGSPKMFYRVRADVPPPVVNNALTYQMGWGWENAPAGARDNMINIMNGVVGIYNRYGTFAKHLYVNYNAGVPTAQGNYNGNMDFGANVGAYHNFRVAMHEVAHTLGVGTTWQWGANLAGGVWQGAAGKAQIKAFDGPGAEAYSDGTHFWPYGMNLSNEGGTVNAHHCVHMVAAFRRDMGIGP